MSEELSKAFDFAQETTKQFITLATGILALTLTFLKDVASSAPAGTRSYLQWGWAVYIASILFGVLAMMSLAGNLERPGEKKIEGEDRKVPLTPSIYRGNIVLFESLQVLTFLIATILVVIFGIKAT
jgi:hypothetical protein